MKAIFLSVLLLLTSLPSFGFAGEKMVTDFLQKVMREFRCLRDQSLMGRGAVGKMCQKKIA